MMIYVKLEELSKDHSGVLPIFMGFKCGGTSDDARVTDRQKQQQSGEASTSAAFEPLTPPTSAKMMCAMHAERSNAGFFHFQGVNFEAASIRKGQVCMCMRAPTACASSRAQHVAVRSM